MELPHPNVAMILGAFVAGLVIVGAVGWLLRRFWRSAFGPAMAPAGFLAVMHVMAVQVDYAVISLLVGLGWWYVFSSRDARPKKEDPQVPGRR